jgi:hypothetical protein
MSRYENRVVLQPVRDSLIEYQLGNVLSAEACNVGELVEPARSAVEAFTAIEELLERASQRLVSDMNGAAAASRVLPRTLTVEPVVRICEPNLQTSEPVGSEVQDAVNDVNLRNYKMHATMIATLRLAAHRGLDALDLAIEAADPGEDRTAAESIRDELLEIARSIGLADERPLERLWPRLVIRTRWVERVKHHAARAVRAS